MGGDLAQDEVLAAPRVACTGSRALQLSDRFSEWRGKAFYLNVRYRARSRKPEDDFVVRHTRMTLTGFGRFELAYFRHTGKWFTVFRGLTAAECFKEIEENEVFWPTT